MADLVVTDIGVRYGGIDSLKGVSFTVPQGRVVAVLGPSGSGKTTLLRAIAGLETPHRGSIVLGETVFFDAEKKIDRPAEKRGLGLVFQSYALWPHRTVFDNIAYGLKLRGANPEQIKTRVETALSQIGLSDCAARRPGELSAGQQQRVALARAIVYEPAAVLLDEPLANLDANLREEARVWLRQLSVLHRLSAVIVTHDQTEAMAIADRIVLLNAGKVEQEGSPTDLYTEPKTLFAARFVGTNNCLEGTLAEMTGQLAVLDVMGVRLEGRTRTRSSKGDAATGVIRVERMRVGGGPGPNRMQMRLTSQMFLGERWELVFVKDALSVRAYASALLRHEFYHVEFPADALWIF